MKEGVVERNDVHGLPWHPGTFPLCLDGIVGGERSTLVAPAVWIRQLARTCSCNGEWFTAAGRFCSVPDHRGIVRGGAMRWCMVWSPNLFQRPVAAHGPWAANVSLCVEMDQPRSLRASSAGPAFFFFALQNSTVMAFLGVVVRWLRAQKIGGPSLHCFGDGGLCSQSQCRTEWCSEHALSLFFFVTDSCTRLAWCVTVWWMRRHVWVEACHVLARCGFVPTGRGSRVERNAHVLPVLYFGMERIARPTCETWNQVQLLQRCFFCASANVLPLSPAPRVVKSREDLARQFSKAGIHQVGI